MLPPQNSRSYEMPHLLFLSRNDLVVCEEERGKEAQVRIKNKLDLAQVVCII
jgi:hypothetical protein